MPCRPPKLPINMKPITLHRLIAIAIGLALSHTQLAWAGGPAPAFGEFVNGGVGRESRQEMESQRNFYNVHLVFAMARKGEYVSGVSLALQRQGDPGAREYVENCGPWFYMRLRPGRYRLHAEFEGKTQVMDIKVGEKAGTHYIFWN